MNEDVVVLENVWKIFGDRANEAMQAIESEGLTKPLLTDPKRPVLRLEPWPQQ